MKHNKYFFSDAIAHPFNHLKEGDWVAYDVGCDIQLVSIAKVIDFELDQYANLTVVLEAPNTPAPKIVRRSFVDISTGKMKKITNPNI